MATAAFRESTEVGGMMSATGGPGGVLAPTGFAALPRAGVVDFAIPYPLVDDHPDTNLRRRNGVLQL